MSHRKNPIPTPVSGGGVDVVDVVDAVLLQRPYTRI